jgi:hypothetical protein
MSISSIILNSIISLWFLLMMLPQNLKHLKKAMDREEYGRAAFCFLGALICPIGAAFQWV